MKKVSQTWFDDDRGILLEIDDGSFRAIKLYTGYDGVEDMQWIEVSQEEIRKELTK